MKYVWVLVAVVISGAMLGCTQNRATTASLPYHQLDWSHSSAAPAPTYHPDSSGQASGDADWANVSGYRQWQYIVIHHSASDAGNANLFDAEHRGRGWDELGYHFVIDNGNGGPDGRVEVGSRWRTQKWGAHTGRTPGNEYNNHGIGICLVGDFSNHLPSAGQLASLHRLVSYLMARYDIPAQNVIGHRDAPGTHTECPGDALHAYIHSSFRTVLSRR